MKKIGKVAIKAEERPALIAVVICMGLVPVVIVAWWLKHDHDLTGLMGKLQGELWCIGALASTYIFVKKLSTGEGGPLRRVIQTMLCVMAIAVAVEALVVAVLPGAGAGRDETPCVAKAEKLAPMERAFRERAVEALRALPVADGQEGYAGVAARMREVRKRLMGEVVDSASIPARCVSCYLQELEHAAPDDTLAIAANRLDKLIRIGDGLKLLLETSDVAGVSPGLARLSISPEALILEEDRGDYVLIGKLEGVLVDLIQMNKKSVELRPVWRRQEGGEELSFILKKS